LCAETRRVGSGVSTEAESGVAIVEAVALSSSFSLGVRIFYGYALTFKDVRSVGVEYHSTGTVIHPVAYLVWVASAAVSASLLAVAVVASAREGDAPLERKGLVSFFVVVRVHLELVNYAELISSTVSVHFAECGAGSADAHVFVLASCSGDVVVRIGVACFSEFRSIIHLLQADVFPLGETVIVKSTVPVVPAVESRCAVVVATAAFRPAKSGLVVFEVAEDLEAFLVATPCGAVGILRACLAFPASALAVNASCTFVYFRGVAVAVCITVSNATKTKAPSGLTVRQSVTLKWVCAVASLAHASSGAPIASLCLRHAALTVELAINSTEHALLAFGAVGVRVTSTEVASGYAVSYGQTGARSSKARTYVLVTGWTIGETIAVGEGDVGIFDSISTGSAGLVVDVVFDNVTWARAHRRLKEDTGSTCIQAELRVALVVTACSVIGVPHGVARIGRIWNKRRALSRRSAPSPVLVGRSHTLACR
jgi:hypothetical protein